MQCPSLPSAVAVEPPTPTPKKKAGPADSWCSTDLQIVQVSYQWTIKNLEFRCVELSPQNKQDVISLSSPPFSCGPDTNPLQWCLKLTVTKLNVNVDLCLVSGSEMDSISHRHKLSLLGHNREILHETKWMHDYRHYLMFKHYLFDKERGFLPDGNLTILCEIEVHDIDKYVHNSAGSIPKYDLSQHLGSLL